MQFTLDGFIDPNKKPMKIKQNSCFIYQVKNSLQQIFEMLNISFKKKGVDLLQIFNQYPYHHQAKWVLFSAMLALDTDLRI